MREAILARASEKCPVCGSDFFGKDEAFCGICGSARPEAPADPRPRIMIFPSRKLPSVMLTVQCKRCARNISAPVITPYDLESLPEGRVNLSKSSPASLQELIELSAIQQNPAAHVARHFEKRELPKAAPLKPVTAESPAITHAEPDHFARPLNFGLEYENQSNQTPAEFSPPDHFAPAVETATVAVPSEALRIVPVEFPPSDKLQPSPWGSARQTQQWLETVKTPSRSGGNMDYPSMAGRRANIYIGVAALILLVVVTGWGVRPSSTTVAGNASPAGSGHHRAAPAPPKLTAFENLMVNLGLAEAPPAPVYLGNPDTQVWVDVHTALYHCPGSDLFGKTPDGRLSTQREAQQDQFEPANRKVCQ